MKLSQNPDMIELMTDNLKQHVQTAIDTFPELAFSIHGVFSLDDLENKLESELGGQIGIGVAYLGADNGQPANNVAGGNIIRTAQFSFIVLLAVPVEMVDTNRANATKLLTVLRNGINGKAVDSNIRNRAWSFVRERPEISESSKTLLYYSQVWQVAMQNLGSV